MNKKNFLDNITNRDTKIINTFLNPTDSINNENNKDNDKENIISEHILRPGKKLGMKNKNQKTRQITVKITLDVYDKCFNFIKDKDITLTELVETALSEFFNK